MDNTELHYLTYDVEELWRAMVLEYVDAGGDILYPGDEKEILLRGVQNIIMLAFAGVDNALRMATLRYAVRGYLDVLGDKIGCPRIQAEAATATVTITTNTTRQSGTLPEGTVLTADGQAFYLTTEDITLTGEAETITTDIRAEKAGAAGNGLVSGTQMGPANSNAAINSIVVVTGASGGHDEEADDVYRERIRKYGMSSATTGPSDNYEKIARNTSSSIIDAKALRCDEEDTPEVHIYLILEDGTTESAAAAILAEVEVACDPKTVRPLSDVVHAYEAEAVEYTLNVQYRGGNTNNLATAVATAVQAYQEWQDNHIGQHFNPDILKSYLYQAGCTQVIFASGSAFDGGNVEYTEIDENQRCKGTITTAVISG